ncbi:MAG: accessory gene regulator B family protein, partial [Clostridia bacterium]
MLSKISKKLTSYFIKTNTIKEDDRAVYDYCFEIMLSTLLNLFALIIIGICTKRYLETFLFSVGFMLLRGSAGGFHASTHIGCFFSLMLFYGIMLIMLEFVPKTVLFYISLCFCAIAGIIILVLAPVDSKNKPLTKDEIKKQRKKSIIYFIVLLLITVILLIFDASRIYAFALSYTFC